MTLPPTWPTVPVFGTYLRVDGTPNEGSVWFETSQRVVVLDENGLTIGVVPRRIIADLDADGHFALTLPCTDAGAQPTGWTWQVFERFNSGQPVYSIEVPQALSAQGINLAQYPHAVPVPVAPPVVSYLTTADIGVTVADQVGVDNAIATANAAAGTASAAQAAAASAVTTANDASAVANAIDGKAQSALDNSNAAVTTANAASATATAAQNTANAIDGKAQSALDASAAATTTANNASATANAIDGKAQSALDNSNAAVTTANAASATANAILPITVAKMVGTASVAGQVPVSQGAGVAPAWGWASPGFKNKVINGNFDFWQRGTSMNIAAGNAGYLADRFNNQSLGGSTAVVSQQAFTIGQTVVPNNPTYFIRHVVTSIAGANNGYRMQHKIEDVTLLQGMPCVLSFWAKADANRNISAQFTQVFVLGGPANVDINGTLCALTTSWQKFIVPVTWPSIAGKTISGSSSANLQFWMDAGSNNSTVTGGLGQQSGTFDFAQIQLEVGAVATPFEMRPFGAELALCQRYFCMSYPQGIPLGVNYPTGSFGRAPDYATNYTFIGNAPFSVDMRTRPSITIFNPVTGSTAAATCGRNLSTSTDVAIYVQYVSTRGFQVGVNNVAVATGEVVAIHYAADAEI